MINKLKISAVVIVMASSGAVAADKQGNWVNAFNPNYKVRSAGCIPRYTKDADAFWVSMLLVPPLLVLNVGARAGDLPNNGKHLRSLSCSTLAIVKHASGSRTKD